MSLEENFCGLSIDAPSCLPLDIIERVVHESSNDSCVLANLCILSKDCARAARKSMYRTLDLTDDLHNPTHPNGSLTSTSGNRAKRRQAMRKNRHLWEHIRSLKITLEDAAHCPNSTNIRFLRFLKKMELNGLEEISIHFGREGTSGSVGHFQVVSPAREILETLLSSDQLQSLSIDIHTAYGSGNPFPGWIFRTLSPTATTICIRTARTSNHTIFPGGTSALLGFTPSVPQRSLSTFRLATNISTNVMFAHNEEDDSMARCSAIFSNLCFNFDVSRVKHLEITTIWNQAVVGRAADEGIWTFPNQAAETLQELIIHRFPNTTSQLGIRPKADHFSKYRALQTLRFDLNLRGQYPDGSDDGCGSLAELLSLPLPPTLHRIFIQVAVGTFFGDYSLDVFTSLSRADLSSWSELDRAICKHSPMSLLAVELIWNSMLPVSPRRTSWNIEAGLEGSPQPNTKRQQREARRVNKRVWEEKVQAMLQQWRRLFQKASDKGILSLRYTHTEIPPPKMY